jgi:hypothetical protein
MTKDLASAASQIRNTDHGTLQHTPCGIATPQGWVLTTNWKDELIFVPTSIMPKGEQSHANG